MNRPSVQAMVFAATGLLFAANSLGTLRGAAFQDARTLEDWFVVLSLSAALILLAFAAPLLSRQAHNRWPTRGSFVVAGAASVAAIANLFEDGVHMDAAFLPFIAATLVMHVGLLTMAIGLALDIGAVRWLAVVPIVTFVDVLALHASGGGMLVLAVWLFAAVFVLRRAPANRLTQHG